MVCLISSHLTLLMLLSALFSVEGVFILKPQSTNVTVNKLFTLKCSTNYNNHSLLFSYKTPPGYSVINLDNPDPEVLPGGGTVITTTFLVTKELNKTNVTCSAIAAGTIYDSDPATITAYDVVPNGLSNIKVCQLDHFVFVSWDKIFTPKGINVTYSISDNRGLQTVIDNSSYPFFFNETSETDYDVNITVTVIATAANQTDNSSITTLQRKLNGTVPLDLSYDKDKSSRVGEEWVLMFKVQLHHLHPDQCIIDNETLEGASVRSCPSNNINCTNSTSVHYDEHDKEINSTNYLAAREKYNSTLRFNHLGMNIRSQPVQTSTHDIQYIEDISNDTSLCLRFHLIHHAQSQEFHLDLRRNKISIRYNVTLPDLHNKTRFEWCASTLTTTSNNNGNWSLYAYDGPEYTNSSAFVLENIVLNITETINTATTHNTIATYTTHTTSMSHTLYSTPIISFSSPLPSSTETATLPSSIKNLTITLSVVAAAAFFTVFVVILIIMVYKSYKKLTIKVHTAKESCNFKVCPVEVSPVQFEVSPVEVCPNEACPVEFCHNKACPVEEVCLNKTCPVKEVCLNKTVEEVCN